ncbi:MAG: YbjQ family protein [Lentisphaeria bacterium]|nr:YbjQ family protein [Lentisphaeria bacterium]
MVIVNTETIPGMKIVGVKGLVQGNTVRAKHVGKDIAASFKNLVGGELKGYTELLVESRREAVARMITQAEEIGANAIVNVRFATSSITAGAAELYAYGTAVTAVEEAPEN